jgi:hypothetical protein
LWVLVGTDDITMLIKAATADVERGHVNHAQTCCCQAWHVVEPDSNRSVRNLRAYTCRVLVDSTLAEAHFAEVGTAGDCTLVMSSGNSETAALYSAACCVVCCMQFIFPHAMGHPMTAVAKTLLDQVLMAPAGAQQFCMPPGMSAKSKSQSIHHPLWLAN